MKGSTVRLGTESDSDSIETEELNAHKISDTQMLLRKNTLNKRNSKFGNNPYLPDYFGRRKKEERVFLDESGVELDYISEQRKAKPADVYKGKGK